MSHSEFTIQNSQFKIAWLLTGSAALLLSPRGLVALVHYETSPVGPYDEWARIVFTRSGPRVVDMAVTSEESMHAGRANWGFPKRLAKLSWKRSGARLEFWTESENYRLRLRGPRLPMRAKFFCVQTLEGREVRVPLKSSGQARIAWRGRQIALLIEDFVFEVNPPVPPDG